ncbi:MAG: two-component system sensor histidine kinase NtrB [Dissulfurimicrobium hydrothermale]|uniref:two-component system sensor histidine kinase NtrB n=1 Tax=Dissulfurimicrobium hydrothermale TaxID=1750598 RepID=UPI003C730A79
MTQCLPLLPIYVVDFIGASLMVVFSLTAFYYSWRLTRLEPKSVLWSYFFWLCMAMVAFALSRSIGHILRFVFIFMGFPNIWNFFAPYSGGLNTMTFVSITTLTFYFPGVRKIIGRVKEDAKKLEEARIGLAQANKSLMDLNQTLEQRVEERTRALKISEQKFRRLFESSKDVIFFCNNEGRLLDMNDSGVELLGFKDKNEIIGKTMAEFFVNKADWENFCATLHSAGHIKDLEIEYGRQDGSILYLLVTSDLISDENGTVIGCEGIAKDLTRYKQVMANLIQSEKMASLGQMAAGVAHEINTPLGIILGYTQLLEEDFKDQKDVYETLETIEKQAKICKNIVSDLLNFSRDSIRQEKGPVDINHCLEEVMAVIEHSLNMDRIYVHRVYGENLPMVFADKERLRQVFVNILNNAHHAIQKEGLVGIWTRYNPAKKTVEILIGDTGPGIPPEILKKIFDPFFTTKEVGKGTGLGLSVSFGIVKDHGGNIDVESPPKEQGLINAGMETVFIVSLPAYIEGIDQEK